MNQTPVRFTDADVKANREGRLTDGQRKRIEADLDVMKAQTKLISVILAITPLTISVVVLTLSVLAEGVEGTIASLPDAVPFLVSMFLWIFVVVTIPTLMGIVQQRGFGNRPIATSDGTASFATRRVGEKTIYYVTLAAAKPALTFQFQDEDSLNNFEERHLYRAYYFAGIAPYLLSAEPLIDHPDDAE